MQEDIHIVLGKYFSGQASAEETGMVKKWAGANEENAADFNLLEKMWNKAGEEERYVFDTNIAWQAVHATLQHTKRTPQTISMISRRSMVAAAVIILLLGAWWIFFSSGPAHTIVANTDVKEVNMKDGSKIYLRKNAILEYNDDFGKDNRNVTLTGEGFFAVMPNSDLPFNITAASTLVKVVGTSFLVNTNDNKVTLVVKTGTVRFGPVSNQSKWQLVARDERAFFDGREITKQKNTNPNYDAWRTKQLVFDNTPLKQVAKDMGNYYQVTFTFIERSIAETGITTRFNNLPLQAALDELSMISACHIRQVSETHFEISLK